MLKDTGITGHALVEHHTENARDGGGAAIDALPTNGAVPPPPPNILELVKWQRQWRHAIKEQMHCNQTCDAFTAIQLGYHVGLPKAERKRLFKDAAAMRLSVEKQMKAQRKKDEKARGHLCSVDQSRGAPSLDGEGHVQFADQMQDVLPACLPIIINTIRSRGGWDQLRETCEPAMREIARTFPVWERVAQIAGFSDFGLAVIVAEAGNDLSAYPHHMHLWKRLGLAPYNGKAGSWWVAKGGLTDKEWEELGYSPRRRGTVAGVVGAPLFFAKADNAYGAIYTARREHTALTHPDWTKAHSDNDARRIMTKALIKDVWHMWRECLPSSAPTPP